MRGSADGARLMRTALWCVRPAAGLLRPRVVLWRLEGEELCFEVMEFLVFALDSFLEVFLVVTGRAESLDVLASACPPLCSWNEMVDRESLGCTAYGAVVGQALAESSTSFALESGDFAKPSESCDEVASHACVIHHGWMDALIEVECASYVFDFERGQGEGDAGAVAACAVDACHDGLLVKLMSWDALRIIVGDRGQWGAWTCRFHDGWRRGRLLFMSCA
jgi:hypothetical protein